ncbi:MAG: hypothetical protein K9K66_04450 [Desulfarculaceae bacterium]|nr:hypothetical protein [Desulfarculaceae bacterium]MCF8073294.1 hypothetical protein [Desulfarculaceae bacterium]MCF8100890.1 hypothetical protein [Desulfarculaceae bacterium]MCF8116654.1 hypothetical protein [Desulfarculaceae bacterium]
MAASKVSICNMALNKLGADPISAWNQTGSIEAKLCAEHFDQALEAILEDHHWSWARCRQSLARLTSTPAFGWSYQYTLPTDPRFIREVRVNDVGGVETAYSIEGRKLLCNVSDGVHLEYTGLIDDPMTMSPKAREALAMKLGYLIAYKITGNRKSEELMGQAYLLTREEAILKDAEPTPVALPEDPWITRRN